MPIPDSLKDFSWGSPVPPLLARQPAVPVVLEELTVQSLSRVPVWLTAGIKVSKSSIKGAEPFSVTVNGSQIVYKAFPDDHSFKNYPVWKHRLKRDLIVKKILKRL